MQIEGEVLRLEIEDKLIVGEVALAVPPGTSAAARDKALEAVLTEKLLEVSAARGAVLAAAVCKYAFPQPGKDDRGRTRFIVRGRVEADRLLPARP